MIHLDSRSWTRFLDNIICKEVQQPWSNFVMVFLLHFSTFPLRACTSFVLFIACSSSYCQPLYQIPCNEPKACLQIFTHCSFVLIDSSLVSLKGISKGVDFRPKSIFMGLPLGFFTPCLFNSSSNLTGIQISFIMTPSRFSFYNAAH